VNKINEKNLYRILDANFNRSKEGLRVCEDICRFVINNKRVTEVLKNSRHELTEIMGSLSFIKFLNSRDIENDVGKKSNKLEFERKNISDIFYANSQRVKESIRVLEEISKLVNKNKAQRLKELRYKIYDIEKEIVKKLQDLSDS